MSSRAFQFRCLALCSVLVAGLSGLSVRLIQIQVWDRKHLADRARSAFDTEEVLPGLRGKIVDRNEEVLAKSMPVSSVFVNISHMVDPKVMAFTLAYERVSQEPGWENLDREKRRRRVKAEQWEVLDSVPVGVIHEQALARCVNLLARPLGMRREEMRERIVKGIGDRKGGEFLLVKDLPEDIARGVTDLMNDNWVEGFTVRSNYRRWYTSENLASHVIGYTGEAKETGENGKTKYRQVGQFGVEASLEDYLAGKDGWREQKRDQTGMRIPGDSGSLMPPRAGFNVQLTLDMGIQAIIEEELDAGLKEFEAPRGCIVVIDPKTGEILGMVSRPSFNLNRLDNLQEAGLNFALQGTYEPGSTIKIVATSAALNERLVTPQTSIFCHNGFYSEGSFTIKDEHPHGMLTFEGVLQKSNNIGTYKLAKQVGMSRFYEYMDHYGYGSRTGILLSGESSGRVRHSGKPVDFSRAAYGYALSVTPLQVACAYSVLANDGKLRKPHIVKSIIANDGTVVESYGPEVVSDVIRPETARAMRKALEKVTGEGGTATAAQVPGYIVAAKTGTAKRIHNGKYQEGHQTVSIAAMMPAEDPAFVCVVVVDDPRTTKVNHYGGSIAGPIFSRAAARIAAHLNLTPTEPVNPKLAGTSKL